MATAEEQLEGVMLVSPIDGIVSDIGVGVGDVMNRSTAVATVVDPTVVEMDGAVDEIDVLYVQIGASASVTMGCPAWAGAGRDSLLRSLGGGQPAGGSHL